MDSTTTLPELQGYNAHTSTPENSPCRLRTVSPYGPSVQLWVGERAYLKETLTAFLQKLLGDHYTPHPNCFNLRPLDDKKDITMEPTRDLLHFLKTTPTLPTWRIVTVHEVERLNRQATNALLKVLEALAPKTLVIFLCESYGRLLPTLLSRCTKVNFGTQRKEAPSSLTQPLGKLFLTMMAKGPASIQGQIDGLDDQECITYVEGLLPFLYKLVTSIKDSAPSKGMEQLLSLAPHSKWTESYIMFSDYLDQAIPAHLPMREILRGALYLIHTPSLGHKVNFSGM